MYESIDFKDILLSFCDKIDTAYIYVFYCIIINQININEQQLKPNFEYALLDVFGCVNKEIFNSLFFVINESDKANEVLKNELITINYGTLRDYVLSEYYDTSKSGMWWLSFNSILRMHSVYRTQSNRMALILMQYVKYMYDIGTFSKHLKDKNNNSLEHDVFTRLYGLNESFKQEQSQSLLKWLSTWSNPNESKTNEKQLATGQDNTQITQTITQNNNNNNKTVIIVII
jgi:hypothetical protein